MFPWKKKKPEANPAVTPTPKPCQHTWKDFPWYIVGTYTKYPNGSSYQYDVIEPYVCIYCGKRENKTLEHIERTNISIHDADQLLQDAYEQYQDYCKPRAIVEDMINDFQLVDPQTLYYYEMLHKQAPKSSFATPSSLRTSTPAKKVELK